MKKKIEILFRTDTQSADETSRQESVENSQRFIYNKRAINLICKELCVESNCYNPEKTILNMEGYLKSPEKIERILYSEISNYIFSLDMKERVTFASNIENLLLYVLNEEHGATVSCKEMAIRIYDHFQLALHQTENINHIFAESIEETKANLQEEIKGIEKEYISILGIFAAIVLAFVGGITFSSSVLQNIGNSSVFRLLMVVDILAVVLINLVYMLIKFILIVNGEESFKRVQEFQIKFVNIFCLAAAGLIVVGWLLNIQNIPETLKNFLPWCGLNCYF